MIGTLLIGTSFALVLQLFYSMVRSKWPANYFSTRQVVEYKLTLGWSRYLLFRGLPTYIAAVLAASTAVNLNFNPTWSVVVLGLAHVGLTVVRSFVESVRARPVRVSVIVADLAVLALIFVSLGLARVSVSYWLPLVPGPDKYVEVLLTGALAAAFMHHVSNLTSSQLDMSAVVDGFLKSMSPAMKKRIAKYCALYRVDERLIHTVLLVESIQRPRWFRRIERVLGRVGLASTHGLMQASNDRKVSDEESLKVGIENLAGSVLIGGQGGFPRESLIRSYLDKHNESSEFQDMVIDALSYMNGNYLPASQYIAEDGSPGIRVKDVRQSGSEWIVTGDAGKELDDIVAYNLDDSAIGLIELSATPDSPMRKTWEFRCEIRVEQLNSTFALLA
jgi:hypothetical protein